ncbi:MAG: beta-lactamase family protein [Firmicutes bacterium]|nr:beta-lactamase family protein [Bacillota bacterium]
MYCYLKDDVHFDHDEIVPWWSFGKVVLATAIMKLVEQERLELDNYYFEEEVTLEQILRHEAGYPDYNTRIYQEAVEHDVEPWEYDMLVERTHAISLLFKPGTGWMYSNIGYYHIRELIERTTGSTLNSALRALIFEPLGLNSAEVATERKQLEYCTHVKNGYHPGWLYHGMIIGTLKDACKFLHCLATGKVISQSTLSKMREAYKIPFDIGNRPWKEPGYAMGLMTDESRGVFGHTGMGPDSVIAVYHYPIYGCTVGVSMKTMDQGSVEFEVERLVHDFDVLKAEA